MVGIRSPISLVVRSCTSHPGVLGSIPKREEPGKTGAPCVQVPGSSRVPASARRLEEHMSSTIPLPPREQLCNRYYSNKRTLPSRTPIANFHRELPSELPSRTPNANSMCIHMYTGTDTEKHLTKSYKQKSPHNHGTPRTQFPIPCPACIVGASGGNPDDSDAPTWAAFLLMYASLGLADDQVTMRITTPKSTGSSEACIAIIDHNGSGALVDRRRGPGLGRPFDARRSSPVKCLAQ